MSPVPNEGVTPTFRMPAGFVDNLQDVRAVRNICIAIAAVLGGAIAGYFVGGGLAVMFMEDEGLEVVGASLVGAGIGALIVPLLILFVTLRPSRERASTGQKVQPRSDDPTGIR